jgi:mannose-1-phosphate guanylyltransferase
MTQSSMGTSIHIQPVILYGGVGTRLRPLYRSGFPRHFLDLAGDESLFRLATKRLTGLGAADIHVQILLSSATRSAAFWPLSNYARQVFAGCRVA